MLNVICATAQVGIKQLNEKRGDWRLRHNIQDYNLSKDDWERIIEQWIFNERDRNITKRRLLDGVPFEPLAEEFGLSVQQTKTIVYRCMEKIIKHCP